MRRLAIHQPMSGLEPGVLGIVRFGGREVTVVDPLLASELDPTGLHDSGERRAGEPALVLLLGHDERQLGLAIDELGSVGGARAAAQGLAGLALRRPEDFLGLAMPRAREAVSADAAGPLCLRLDVSGLLTRFQLSVLARIDEQGPARAKSTQAIQWRINREAYLVFQAGQRWAAPVADFLALLPLQVEKSLSAPDSRSVRGSMQWRDRIITLRDYAHARGGVPLTSGEPLVVMVVDEDAEQACGWLVSRLERLIPPNTARLSEITVLGGKALSVISVGASEQALSFQVVQPGRRGAGLARARELQRAV